MPHTLHATTTHIAPGATVAAPDATTLVAFFAVALFGGGNAVAAKLGLIELAPLWSASLRFLIASALLLVIIAVLRHKLPRGRALLGVLAYGLLAFGGAFSFGYYALTEVGAGTVQVTMALVPLLTLVLAVVERVEAFRTRALIGALVAAAGIAVVFSGSIGTASPGALAALIVAALCVAQASVIVKGFPRVGPLVENAVAMGVGGLVLLGLSLAFSEPWIVPTATATQLSLGYLVVFGSMAMFGLYVFVIGRWTATGATYALLIMPLFTILLAALVLGERPSLSFAVGAAVVLAGVWFGALAPHKR